MILLAALFAPLSADTITIDHLFPHVVTSIPAEKENECSEKIPVVRWGILGTSAVAIDSILPALQYSNQSTVRAIASRSRRKATKIALAARVPKTYGSYDELLADPNIDAVYIALPNHLHKKWTIKAAQAGKHVLCEKPLACSTTDCQAMAEACQAQNVKLMQAFKHLYHPQMERIQELIDSDIIGEPTLIRISLSYPLVDLNLDQSHRWRAAQGGGCLLDLGCYCIQMARWIFGAEPLTVTATTIEDPDHAGVEAQVHAVLTFSNNRTAMIDCSFVLGERQEVEIIGRGGSLNAHQLFHPGLQGPIVIQWNRLDGCVGTEEIDDADPYQLEVDHFNYCIREGCEPLSNGLDAVRNAKVLDALKRAARLGKTVPIKE